MSLTMYSFSDLGKGLELSKYSIMFVELNKIYWALGNGLSTKVTIPILLTKIPIH